ncbi:MAG: GNAT family N-acetyltransferase, partial [Oscillospiraceae bacterium]|nr:GNAT family N-acetyltransferase [Oscillospiraceae bacterium]
MSKVELKPYERGCESTVLADIAAFWMTHYLTVTPEQAKDDLEAWTGARHELYVILADGVPAGFLHMGERGGGACDWLEDVFVREELRGRGIGGQAIELA